jgi:TolA-binding protein
MDLFFKLLTTIKIQHSCYRKKLLMKSWCAALVLLAGQAFSQSTLLQQNSERLFSTGLDLMSKGQYGAALENFNQYMTLNPANGVQKSDAEYYQALCAINLFHSDAEKRMTSFLKANPSSSKASFANFDLANYFYTGKNYKRASSYFEKVDFNSLPSAQQQEGRFKWGYSLFNLKSLKESLDQFNYVKTVGGQYGPAASYYAGFVEYSQADYSNALVDLKRADQSEAYRTIVPYLMANVLYSQKDYEGLLAYVPTVMNREGLSNAGDIQLLVAESSFKRKDYRNALDGYNRYLDGKTETADKGVLLRAGFTAFRLGDDDKALEYLKSSFADKDSVGFYSAYYLGQLYLKKGQKTMALSAFDISRKYLPDPKLVEEASFQFAKVSYELGRPDQAITEMEKLLKRFPNSDHEQEIKELLSQAYVNANNYNKAIEHIESLPQRGAVVNRAYQKATLLKGMELFNLEDYTAANEYFKKSLAYPVDKGYEVEANFWMGETYSVQREYDKAEPPYLKVIDLTSGGNPYRLKARYGLGYAFFNSKEYDRALFNFREFVSTSPAGQPNLADGALRLADCYYVSKSYSEALTNYKRSVSLNSVDADYAHLQAGIILGILRNYSEAEQELRLTISKYPGSRFNDEAQFRLAQVEFEQGKYQEAVNGYSALIVSHPSSRFTPYAHVRRAASYFNLKEYSKTSQDYITVIEKYGNHPASKDVLLPLQESLNLEGKSGEFDKYLALYKTANPDAKGIEVVEFETAKNLYNNQDYAKAKTGLQSFLSAYPESPQANDARYFMAESMYRLKEFSPALAVYYDLSKIRQFSLYNKVISRIAEIEFKQGNYAKAVPAYNELAKVATNKKDLSASWNGLMESHYQLKNFDSTEVYAQKILNQGSVNVGAQSKASLFLGKSAMSKGDYETAKDEFLNTVNTARDEYSAEAKYLIAEIFFKSKDYKQCYETLVSLNSDFQNFTPWVGKSYLLMSDYYLAMGDKFQTRATLQSLIDNFPLPDVKDAATVKLKALDQEEAKVKQTLSKDTVENK